MPDFWGPSQDQLQSGHEVWAEPYELSRLGKTRLVKLCMGPASIEGLDSWPNNHEGARHHMRSLLCRLHELHPHPSLLGLPCWVDGSCWSACYDHEHQASPGVPVLQDAMLLCCQSVYSSMPKPSWPSSPRIRGHAKAAPGLCKFRRESTSGGEYNV